MSDTNHRLFLLDAFALIFRAYFAFANNPRRTSKGLETSAIYGLGRLLGHQCLSLNVVVANRVTQTFSKDGTLAATQLIENALATIATIS